MVREIVGAMVILCVACGGNSAPPNTASSGTSSTSAPASGGSSVAGEKGTSQTAQPAASLSMEAKRAMKHFQEDQMPWFLGEIKRVCGYDITVDVDWSTFTTDESIRSLGSNRGVGSSNEMAEGFHTLCRDAVGKDAMKTKVTKISFKNISDKANKKIYLEGKVLHVDGAWTSKELIEGTFPSSAYSTYLTKQL